MAGSLFRSILLQCLYKEHFKRDWLTILYIPIHNSLKNAIAFFATFTIFTIAM